MNVPDMGTIVAKAKDGREFTIHFVAPCHLPPRSYLDHGTHIYVSALAPGVLAVDALDDAMSHSQRSLPRPSEGVQAVPLLPDSVA